VSATAALLVALGAAAGAPLRFLAGHHLDRRGPFPWGTLLVNVVGSGLLGWFSGLALDERAWAFLGVGFCGALTTYSAFAVQAVGLGVRRGAVYVAITLPTALAACTVGFALV
jgi:fluoride exporter